MNYYYDINLDFFPNKVFFYDVDRKDKFSLIKKIPIFLVNEKIIKDLIMFNVKVDNTFLELINNKTIVDKEKINYACILTDKNNAWAFSFNEYGHNIAISPLPINDELNILEVIYTIKKIDITYEKISKRIINKGCRIEEKIKNIIIKEIEKIEKENDIEKLKYLYLEWFDKKEVDSNTMIKEIKNKLNGEITNIEEKVSKIIEMSYNNV